MTDAVLRELTLSGLFRMAILKGAEASVLLHIRRGAPLEGRDERGRTPLLLAAAAGRVATCQLLISEGADIAAIDKEGLTAAKLAERAGFAEIVEALLPLIGQLETVRPLPAETRVDATPLDAAAPADANDDDGVWQWEADEVPDTAASDITLAATVTTVQVTISEHRAATIEDAWAAADIRIPQPARVGRPRVAVPEGVVGLFSRALHQGWVSLDQIASDLRGADADIHRIAKVALELSGIRIDGPSDWARSTALQVTAGKPLSQHRDLEDVVALLEDLLSEAIDPAKVYSETLARFAVPDREEESRLFQNLADARKGLLAIARGHRRKLISWLDRADSDSHDGQTEDGTAEADAVTGDEPENLLAIDLEPLRSLLGEHDVGEDFSGHALPYAGFVRLLQAAPPVERSGETGLRLARALERFRHARDRVATVNLKLVSWTARRYHRADLSTMDLIQEGNIGLLRAIEKFDPTRGARFSTYAIWWIRQAMTRAIADQSRLVRVPVHAAEVFPRLERLDAAWMARTGTLPSDQEAATVLDRTPVLINRLRATPVEPLPFSDDLDGSHWFPGSGPRSPDHPQYRSVARDRRNGLSRVLAQLSPREERVLRMRFGLGIASDMTLEEVGSRFDVTRERIRQIEAKAMRRLTHPIRLREIRLFS